MKKAVITILLITFALTPSNSSTKAQAESVKYLRVIDTTTPFFSDQAGENLLFYLPYTYYVKVLETEASLTHVECYGSGETVQLDGYVPSDKLCDDGQSVESPYLAKTLKTINTTLLYQDCNLTQSIQYVFADRTLKYYGQLPASDGSICFYVSYNNKLGYIKETDVEPFTVENHPNELTFLKQESVDEPTPPNEEKVEETSKTETDLRIIIIACLMIAGFIAVAISIKNKPKKQDDSSYYEETDCE